MQFNQQCKLTLDNVIIPTQTLVEISGIHTKIPEYNLTFLSDNKLPAARLRKPVHNPAELTLLGEQLIHAKDNLNLETTTVPHKELIYSIILSGVILITAVIIIVMIITKMKHKHVIIIKSSELPPPNINPEAREKSLELSTRLCTTLYRDKPL